MNSPLMRFIIALTVWHTFAASSASAVEPFAETPQERALCSALVYGGMDRDSRMKLEGQDRWLHTHHYCDCIRFRFRALRSLGDRSAVNYNLGIAIGGCDYVLKAVPRDYFLRARIHVDKGRALKLRGDRHLASQEFQAAIEADPREVNAYLELSELLRESGQGRQALETTTDGLRHNPDAKMLQKSYLDLGGKEPFPEPIQRNSEPERATRTEPSDRLTGDASRIVQEPGSAATGTQDEAESSPTNLGESQQINGRSCRFCPPEEVLQRWNDTFPSTKETNSTKGGID